MVQRSPQRARVEEPEPATTPQPAGRGQPNIGTWVVPQREQSREPTEAVEPQDPGPQDPEPPDRQNQEQRDHLEGKRKPTEVGQRDPQRHQTAEAPQTKSLEH